MESAKSSKPECLQHTELNLLNNLNENPPWGFKKWNNISADTDFKIAYEWNIVNDAIEWYGKIHERLGYLSSEFPLTLRGWETIIHAVDRERVKNAIHRHLKTQEMYLICYRVRQRNGDFLFAIDTGTALRNPEGVPYKWAGVIQLLDNPIKKLKFFQ